MEKKVVILNAGKGRRMGKLGKQIPKCLFPILGKPILFHQVDKLVEIGVREITIVIGYRDKDISAKIRKASQYSFLRCLFNPFYQYTDSIVSLWLYLRLNQRDESGIIVLSGDRILHSTIYQVIGKVYEFTVITLGPKKYSVIPKDSIGIKEDRVISIGEKSSYVNGGILFVPGEKRINLLNSIETVLFFRKGLQRWYLEGVKEMLKNGETIKALTVSPDFCVNINRPTDLDSPQIMRILERRGFND